MTNNGSDPMALHHEAMDATVERLSEMQQSARERLVTAPAVGEEVSGTQKMINYLKIRDNPDQLQMMFQQYGLRRVVDMCVEGEALLQRRMEKSHRRKMEKA
jgi:hypothetical protein